MNPGKILEQLLEILEKTNKRQTFIESMVILEKLIAYYFNGNNYKTDDGELSRGDSKIMAYTLLHCLEFQEMILERGKKHN